LTWTEFLKFKLDLYRQISSSSSTPLSEMRMCKLTTDQSNAELLLLCTT